MWPQSEPSSNKHPRPLRHWTRSPENRYPKLLTHLQSFSRRPLPHLRAPGASVSLQSRVQLNIVPRLLVRWSLPLGFHPPRSSAHSPFPTARSARRHRPRPPPPPAHPARLPARDPRNPPAAQLPLPTLPLPRPPPPASRRRAAENPRTTPEGPLASRSRAKPRGRQSKVLRPQPQFETRVATNESAISGFPAASRRSFRGDHRWSTGGLECQRGRSSPHHRVDPLPGDRVARPRPRRQ